MVISKVENKAAKHLAKQEKLRIFSLCPLIVKHNHEDKTRGKGRKNSWLPKKRQISGHTFFNYMHIQHHRHNDRKSMAKSAK